MSGVLVRIRCIQRPKGAYDVVVNGLVSHTTSDLNNADTFARGVARGAEAAASVMRTRVTRALNGDDAVATVYPRAIIPDDEADQIPF